jgi:1-acyl-sn-glycerol-3-phosphate acyltransferase
MYFFYILILFYLFWNSNINVSKNILYFLGYTIKNNNIDLPSKIIIIGSHTSIYDFFIGLFIYYSLLYNNYSANVLMKQQFEIICSPILQFFDTKFNLISIETNKKMGITNQICSKLQNKDNFIIFLAPEGTRKCTEKIRSGYWHISKNLNINIMYLGIDYYNKTITFENHRPVKETWEEEQHEFIKSCKKYIPLYPERCFWTKNYYNEE